MAELLKQGGDTNDLIRAAYALARIGGPEAIGTLQRSLDEVESGYRPLIVEALDQTGPEGHKGLLRLLDHGDPAVRAMVVRHLGLRRRGREELKPLLRKVLGDQSRDVQHAALQVIGQFGPEAKDVVPRLVELQEASDPSIRAESAVALIQIGGTVPESSLPILLAAARDRSQPGRWRVIEALGRAGPPAVPALSQALREDGTVRLKAAEALGRIGPEAREAVPALIEAARGADWTTRAQLALALWKVDRQAESALPMLIAALKSPALSPLSNPAAMPILPPSRNAIRKFSFGRPSPTSLHLSTVYPSGHSEFMPIVDLIGLRRQMIEALGQMGPKARAALPVLTEISAEEEGDARRAAAEALKQIDPEGEAGEGPAVDPP
jgi:HEAT repeat protein